STSVPSGSSTSAAFYYEDTKAGTPFLQAIATGYASAGQTETITAAALATITVSPTSVSLIEGGSQKFTASGADAYGNPTDVSAAAWSVAPTTVGALSPTTGASSTFTASATTAGSGQVSAVIGTVSGTATVSVSA